MIKENLISIAILGKLVVTNLDKCLSIDQKDDMGTFENRFHHTCVFVNVPRVTMF